MATYNELILQEIIMLQHTENLQEGLDKLMQNINIKNKVFYDLGSGKGTLFLYAIKYLSLKKCKGIELHNIRHQEALQKLKEEQETIHKKGFIYTRRYFKKSIGDGDIFILVIYVFQ